MADTVTATYDFTAPEVGASDDTWGAKLNANWVKMDDLLTQAFTGGNASSVGRVSPGAAPSQSDSDYTITKDGTKQLRLATGSNSIETLMQLDGPTKDFFIQLFEQPGAAVKAQLRLTQAGEFVIDADAVFEGNVSFNGEVDLDDIVNIGRVVIDNSDNYHIRFRNNAANPASGKSVILSSDSSAFRILVSDTGDGADNGTIPFSINKTHSGVFINHGLQVTEGLTLQPAAAGDGAHIAKFEIAGEWNLRQRGTGGSGNLELASLVGRSFYIRDDNSGNNIWIDPVNSVISAGSGATLEVRAKLNVPNSRVTDPTNLANHINLYASNYGFSVSDDDGLNAVVPSGTYFRVYRGGTMVAEFSGTSGATENDFTVMTRIKGDTRYRNASNINAGTLDAARLPTGGAREDWISQGLVDFDYKTDGTICFMSRPGSTQFTPNQVISGSVLSYGAIRDDGTDMSGIGSSESVPGNWRALGGSSSGGGGNNHFTACRRID